MKSEKIVMIPGTTYRATENGLIVNKQGRPLIGHVVGTSVMHTIRVNKKTVVINTARTIYETFRGKIPAGYIIIHIDGNSTNNSIDNLKKVKRASKRNLSAKAKYKLSLPRRRYNILYESIDCKTEKTLQTCSSTC